MSKKENNIWRFGPGYRSFTSVRKVQICPICASSDPDVCLEELPTEQFRFEKCGDPEDPDCPIRIRSDVSMLLHATDLAKKYGQNFVQSMINLRKPKSSSIQESMDKMSDDQILDTIKSRHLQSPSELIAWSEYLTEQAKSIEREADLLALDEGAIDTANTAGSQSTEPQSE